jgi:hypothetical protein
LTLQILGLDLEVFLSFVCVLMRAQGSGFGGSPEIEQPDAYWVPAGTWYDNII